MGRQPSTRYETGEGCNATWAVAAPYRARWAATRHLLLQYVCHLSNQLAGSILII